MSGDPLFSPLGAEPPRAAPRGLWMIPVAVAMIGVAAGAWALRQGREPGRAVAVATIETAPPAQQVQAAPPPPPSAAVPPPAAVETTTVEMQNGVKVVRFNPAASAHGLTALPMPPVGGRAAAALAPAPDPRVTEATAHGPLPRIGPGALHASDVYGRPAPAGSGPRVAVLLTGMGGDELATADAARRLSPDVSFGFAPEVADVAAQVDETRRAGHEVLLDLLPLNGQAEAAGAGDLTALHRQMATFAGYAGVVADAAAPPAIMRDIADRGVVLVVPGSAAPGAMLAPDITVDAVSGHAALAGVIDKLARIARSKGSAFGVIAHAGGATGEIAGLLATLSRAGVTLVPVSALGAAAGGTSAAK